MVELEEVCDEVLSLQTVLVDFPQQKSTNFLTGSRKVLATAVDNWSSEAEEKGGLGQSHVLPLCPPYLRVLPPFVSFLPSCPSSLHVHR